MEEQFWRVWEKFEIYYGSEDTFKDFMKHKRTVELKYSISAPSLETSGAPKATSEE